MFGIPKDPFGLSTNLKAGMFNLPAFQKCKVVIQAGSQITVHLNK